MGRFIVTIARGYGSGGRTIATKLAQELGVPCYDKELLRLASSQSGINELLFAKADEKLKNSLLFQIAKAVYTKDILPPDSDSEDRSDDVISNDRLFAHQEKVLKGLAEKGSFVVLGRCADYVLRDYPNLVRVFIHAPFEDCVAAEAKHSSLTLEEIKKYIRAVDKRRAEYYEHYTGRLWNDALNYDLCLNTSAIGRENCVGLIKEYLKKRLGTIE